MEAAITIATALTVLHCSVCLAKRRSFLSASCVNYILKLESEHAQEETVHAWQEATVIIAAAHCAV